MEDMTITQRCIDAVNNGEADFDDLIFVIENLEAENAAYEALTSHLSHEMSMQAAKITKLQDTLYAVTHGDWKIRAIDKKRG